MNEIIRLLEKLKANCGDNRGMDGEFLSDDADAILKLAQAEPCNCDDKGVGQYHLPGCALHIETNAQRVRRIIAAGQLIQANV